MKRHLGICENCLSRSNPDDCAVCVDFNGFKVIEGEVVNKKVLWIVCNRLEDSSGWTVGVEIDSIWSLEEKAKERKKALIDESPYKEETIRIHPYALDYTSEFTK